MKINYIRNQQLLSKEYLNNFTFTNAFKVKSYNGLTPSINILKPFYLIENYISVPRELIFSSINTIKILNYMVIYKLFHPDIKMDVEDFIINPKAIVYPFILGNRDSNNDIFDNDHIQYAIMPIQISKSLLYHTSQDKPIGGIFIKDPDKFIIPYFYDINPTFDVNNVVIVLDESIKSTFGIRDIKRYINILLTKSSYSRHQSKNPLKNYLFNNIEFHPDFESLIIKYDDSDYNTHIGFNKRKKYVLENINNALDLDSVDRKNSIITHFKNCMF